MRENTQIIDVGTHSALVPWPEGIWKKVDSTWLLVGEEQKLNLDQILKSNHVVTSSFLFCGGFHDH